jgi:hypothetical protein
MAKSKLEQLLLEATNFTAKVEKQTLLNEEAVIKTAIKEQVQKFINEAAGEVDDDMDFDETTPEAETPEADMEDGEAEDTTGLDTDTDDMSFGDEEESFGDDEMSDESDEMPLDVSAGMGDETMGADTLDLSNLSMDELKNSIEDIVSQLGDNETLEFVKKPSIQITKKPAMGMGGEMGGMPTTLDAEADDDTEMEFDLDDEAEGEGEEADDFGSEESEEGEDDFGAEGEESEEGEDESEEDEDESEEDEVKEGKQFNLKNNISKGGKNAPFGTKGKKSVNEMDDMLEGCQDESVYEGMVKENRQLKGHLKKMVSEIKAYKAREVKSYKMIKESMAKLQSLALTNTNLAYFVRLVNEHATTSKEKEDILKKLDAAKTVRESEITFRMVKESLNKRPLVKNPMSKNPIQEGKNGKTIIKEEKAFVSKEQQRVLDMMTYKPRT